MSDRASLVHYVDGKLAGIVFTARNRRAQDKVHEISLGMAQPFLEVPLNYTSLIQIPTALPVILQDMVIKLGIGFDFVLLFEQPLAEMRHRDHGVPV